jgi:molybdate transport system substrate-binding protein
MDKCVMYTPIKILSGGAMKSLLDEAVPLFERAHGAKVDGAKVEVEYRLTSVLQKDIAAGAAFDIALLPRPELDGLVKAGKIAPDTTADIARSSIGVAVRAGAPKPDLGTAEALKRALRAARTISYSDGPSGLYVAGLLQRLGIADEMAPKTRLTTGPVAELIAKGEAEIGLQQIVAILPVKGAELAGPLPAELQNVITYAAGLPAGAAAGVADAAAQAFIAFMGTAETAALIRRKGLEPA